MSGRGNAGLGGKLGFGRGRTASWSDICKQGSNAVGHELWLEINDESWFVQLSTNRFLTVKLFGMTCFRFVHL